MDSNIASIVAKVSTPQTDNVQSNVLRGASLTNQQTSASLALPHAQTALDYTQPIASHVKILL